MVLITLLSRRRHRLSLHPATVPNQTQSINTHRRLLPRLLRPLRPLLRRLLALTPPRIRGRLLPRPVHQPQRSARHSYALPTPSRPTTRNVPADDHDDGIWAAAESDAIQPG